MGLESATYLNGLVDTNPGATDNVSQGDDHLRLIKSVLKSSFPSVDAAVNAIHTGTSAPSTSISAGLLWFDTTNNVLKLRNEANDAWITLPISPVTSNTVDIDGGSIDGTAIGASSASTGKFSSVNIAADGATVTGIKDEDDMSSDSNVKLATQQSIKAYVDSQVTAQDLDLISDSGTIDIDLDSESLTVSGGEGIDTSATGTTLTIAGEDASTSNKGIASFNSANFAASSGDITIKDGGVANAELADMAANTVKVRNANSSGVPSDLALATTEIMIGDGTGFTAASLSGDVSMTNAGVVTVDSIQGTAVSSTAPTNDQYMKYSSTSSEWQMVSIVGSDKLTTKGDLLVYNTVDSETRMGVGTNDYVLVADSTATNGVDWQQVATAGIADDAVTGAKISFIDDSVAVTDGHVLVADGTDYNNVAVSGDISITNAGVVSLADNSVTLAKLEDGTQGDILYYGASGAPARLGFGTSGYFLKTQGTGANPVWAEVGGGISWQAVVTGATTMVAGRGYFVDTTSTAFSMTLPASASLGDEVHIIDYAGTFDTNNCTVARNSHNISGAASDLVVATERAAFKLVYVDATQGWLLTEV